MYVHDIPKIDSVCIYIRASLNHEKSFKFFFVFFGGSVVHMHNLGLIGNVRLNCVFHFKFGLL